MVSSPVLTIIALAINPTQQAKYPFPVLVKGEMNVHMNTANAHQIIKNTPIKDLAFGGIEFPRNTKSNKTRKEIIPTLRAKPLEPLQSCPHGPKEAKKITTEAMNSAPR